MSSGLGACLPRSADRETARFVRTEVVTTLDVRERFEPELHAGEILKQRTVVLAGMTHAQSIEQSRIDLDPLSSRTGMPPM